MLTLAHSLLAGGDCIDDANLLRTGATSRVLGHRVMAPSTLGTFLRSFTFGHIRQLDQATETILTRAWAAGAGPGQALMTIDIDATVCQVHGHAKGGAPHGSTRQLGYHPLLATRADSGEIVDLRMRADSGLWSAKVLAACRRHRIRHSVTVPADQDRRQAIAYIPEDGWVDIAYPDTGQAQVAETPLAGKAGGRLIVRRTRLVGPQATLWPDRRYHAFVTDRPGTTVELDADHRRHAVVELCIRDLKQGAGLCHCPRGICANAAWAVIVTLAHNLLRWVAAIGLGATGPVVAKTIRRRLLHLPGRLTRSACRRWLHLPAGWPWAQAFTRALARLRALPLLA